MTSEPLRLIFDTQSTGLRLFWNLYKALKENGGLGSCGFFITNKHEFSVFAKKNLDFRKDDIRTLAEWDILALAKKLPAPDLARIEAWENEFADPTFWNTIIIDRRMNYKMKAQFAQNYEPAYGHEDLLKILQCAIEAISAQFDVVRPHAVVGLNAVTLYDYLYYLIAEKRGIPYFQLKLTRVQNYISFFTKPFDLSPHIVEAFEKMKAGQVETEEDRAALDEARAFLAEVRAKTLVYEGAIKKPGEKDEKRSGESKRSGLMARFFAWGQRLVQMLSVKDEHYPTLLYSMIQIKILRILRRRLMRFSFDIVDAGNFAARTKNKFALYPLNTEPEVALLAFGRPYRNQIETVRNIASSLPVGWKLVVKEHPNAFGYRTGAYYKKLKQIPNVLIAGPKADTGKLTDACSLLVLVYGTIGLEAIIKKKPTILLSRPPYAVFSERMVRYAPDPWILAEAIRNLLREHKHDESEVEAYIAAHIRTGVRANLFTELLGKGGRQKGEGRSSVDEQYRSLAFYARKRIKEEQQRIHADDRS